jgi:hypothetical protein
MCLNSKIWMAILLVFSLFHTDVLFSDIQKIEIQEIELKECLLPKDHPLQKQLKNLFKDPEMFRSPRSFRQAGFLVSKSYRERHVMIGRHPHIPNYIFKKFRNQIPQHDQLANYLKRVNGARHLRKFIDLNHLSHVVVPQKWIYRLPKQYSDSETKERTYILIVEDMNIYNSKESIKRYHTIPFDVLKELCIVVYYFRGFDSIPNNLPFTQSDKIAFVDTEKWDDWNREYFLLRIVPHMNEDRKQYAQLLFEELSVDKPHSPEPQENDTDQATSLESAKSLAECADFSIVSPVGK